MKNENKALIGIVAIVLVAVAVTQVAMPPSVTLGKNITGFVSTSTGVELAGTTIQMFDANNTLMGTAYARSSGNFEFQNITFTNGTYKFVAATGESVGEKYVGMDTTTEDIGVIYLEQ